MKTKNLPRQVRLAILRQNAEQEDLLQETPWEKRQRENEERWEAYWDAVDRGDSEDW